MMKVVRSNANRSGLRLESGLASGSREVGGPGPEVDGKSRHLGYYADPHEAAQAYTVARAAADVALTTLRDPVQPGDAVDPGRLQGQPETISEARGCRDPSKVRSGQAVVEWDFPDGSRGNAGGLPPSIAAWFCDVDDTWQHRRGSSPE